MLAEYAFTLPRGWIGPDGEVHRHGTMRLATARDEIEPQADPAVHRNEAYLAVLVLARVITSLGPVRDVTPAIVQDLFAVDFEHLQLVYERLNSDAATIGAVTCPACAHAFEVDLSEIHDGALAHH